MRCVWSIYQEVHLYDYMEISDCSKKLKFKFSFGGVLALRNCSDGFDF